MASTNPPPRARIAEARRNRATLIAVATRIFASARTHVSLESIAREAGVGIGTLYRHFPTREALVAAVYQDQIDRLGAGADELLSQAPPSRALRLWMDLFADWVATKNGMIDSLRAMSVSGAVEYGDMRARLEGVIGRFLAAGAHAGDIRADARAEDVAALLVGALSAAGSPQQTARVLDLVADGLRSPAGP